jgi:transcriptional regulator with XRE-family HTH domain
MPVSTIGTTIKERRQLLGLSQENLAELAGVGIRTLRDLERGVGNPSLRNLEQLADVLGLELCLHIKKVRV